MRVMFVKDRNVLNKPFVVNFVNQLQEAGCSVDFVVDTAKKVGEGYAFNPDVRLRNLCPVRLTLWQRVVRLLDVTHQRYRRLVRQCNPDVIVCYFLCDLAHILRWGKVHCPVVLMFHTYPPVFFENVRCSPLTYRFCYRPLLRRVDCFQVLFPADCETVAREVPGSVSRAIPNMVLQVTDDDVRNRRPERTVIYVARMDKAGKRQHLLIDCFARLAPRFPDWTLEFYGEMKHPGYCEALRAQIRRLGLAERVFLRGFTNELPVVYRRAALQAFPSPCESFGVALADGLMHGVPAVGFADAPGVNRLIRDGKNGFLARDEDDFTEKMATLMSDDGLRRDFGAQAHEDMKAYSPHSVVAAWVELFNTVASRASVEGSHA